MDKGAYHALAMVVAKKKEYKPACGNSTTLLGQLERYADVYLQDMAAVVDEGVPMPLETNANAWPLSVPEVPLCCSLSSICSSF